MRTALADRLAALPLTVGRAAWRELELATGTSWTRRTRELRLGGAGCEGAGEDVSWAAVPIAEVEALYPLDRLAFRGTFGEWSLALDALEQSPEHRSVAAERSSEPDFLRWALESAGAELALRQNRCTLVELFERPIVPPRFGLSMGLGEPASTAVVEAWLAHGAYRFKLDASSSWSAPLIARLHELDAVDVVDLKAYYHGTPVDQDADPELYARVAAGLPGVVLEDLLATGPTQAIARSVRDRLAFDAPVHSIEDLARVVPAALGLPIDEQRVDEQRVDEQRVDEQPVDGLPLEGTPAGRRIPVPRFLNVKPSRFGTWRRLLAAYAFGERNGVSMYGGGQYELGIGREQIQALAAIFHAEGPNDIAPAVFHGARPRGGLPTDRVPLEMFGSSAFAGRSEGRPGKGPSR